MSFDFIGTKCSVDDITYIGLLVDSKTRTESQDLIEDYKTILRVNTSKRIKDITGVIELGYEVHDTYTLVGTINGSIPGDPPPFIVIEAEVSGFSGPFTPFHLVSSHAQSMGETGTGLATINYEWQAVNEESLFTDDPEENIEPELTCGEVSEPYFDDIYYNVEIAPSGSNENKSRSRIVFYVTVLQNVEKITAINHLNGNIKILPSLTAGFNNGFDKSFTITTPDITYIGGDALVYDTWSSFLLWSWELYSSGLYGSQMAQVKKVYRAFSVWRDYIIPPYVEP